MAIISFFGIDKKQVGQTHGMAAVITYMAAKHNCKILGVETGFQSRDLEKCYWNVVEEQKLDKDMLRKSIQVGLESGVEDLVRTIASNKITPETVANYAKIVFKKRLDLLLAPKTKIYEEYQKLLPMYVDILKLANNYYDFVFVDISKDFPDEIRNQILELSEVVCINIKQNMESINAVMDMKTGGRFEKLKNPIILLENADIDSKYNKKNITRYLRERNPISVIPHNTLFFEACDEAKIADFFFKVKIKSENSMTNKNSIFIREIDDTVQEILMRIN